MKQVLKEPPVQRFERIASPVKQRVVETLSPAVAEITHKKPKLEIEDDEEEEVIDFGELASPYLKPYLHNARFFDKQYRIRREDVSMFMIGGSVSTVDDTSDISLKGKHFKGT